MPNSYAAAYAQTQASLKKFDIVDKKLKRLPEEVRRELFMQCIEEPGRHIATSLAAARNFGFTDRTGQLRRSVRVGKPKTRKTVVMIPIIAGRNYSAFGSERSAKKKGGRRSAPAYYAGFQEFGTSRFFANSFLRPGLIRFGAHAQSIFAKCLGRRMESLSENTDF